MYYYTSRWRVHTSKATSSRCVSIGSNPKKKKKIHTLWLLTHTSWFTHSWSHPTHTHRLESHNRSPPHHLIRSTLRPSWHASWPDLGGGKGWWSPAPLIMTSIKQPAPDPSSQIRLGDQRLQQSEIQWYVHTVYTYYSQRPTDRPTDQPTDRPSSHQLRSSCHPIFNRSSTRSSFGFFFFNP